MTQVITQADDNLESSDEELESNSRILIFSMKVTDVMPLNLFVTSQCNSSMQLG